MNEFSLKLWDFEFSRHTPRAIFQLGKEIGPDWVILRNYEFENTGKFRANPRTGIVGIFPPKSTFKLQKGFVIPVNTLLEEAEGFVYWKDWSRFLTVVNPPEHCNLLHVFHTHVLYLHPLTLKCYVYDFSPYTTGLNSTTRGSPVPTFSGRIPGWKLGNTSTNYFPTEHGILSIKVSPIHMQWQIVLDL